MQKTKYLWVLTWALIGFMSYSPQARPQPTEVSNSPGSTNMVDPPLPPTGRPKTLASGTGSRFSDPPLPSGGTPSGHRFGAGTRCTNCPPPPPLPLTALVPGKELADHSESEAVWGQTVEAHPTFWFYVPYSSSSLQSLEFALQKGDNDVYRTAVTLPQSPGVVSFRLPFTSKPLEIGKSYHWFFKTFFKSQKPSTYVDGWIQRVTLSSTALSQLKTATPQERFALYATNGIWYDALTTVTKLRLVQPDDPKLRDEWNDLLKSIGLAKIISTPLVQCCTPTEKFTEK